MQGVCLGCGYCAHIPHIPLIPLIPFIPPHTPHPPFGHLLPLWEKVPKGRMRGMWGVRSEWLRYTHHPGHKKRVQATPEKNQSSTHQQCACSQSPASRAYQYQAQPPRNQASHAKARLEKIHR